MVQAGEEGFSTMKAITANRDTIYLTDHTFTHRFAFVYELNNLTGKHVFNPESWGISKLRTHAENLWSGVMVSGELVAWNKTSVWQYKAWLKYICGHAKLSTMKLLQSCKWNINRQPLIGRQYNYKWVLRIYFSLLRAERRTERRTEERGLSYRSCVSWPQLRVMMGTSLPSLQPCLPTCHYLPRWEL